MAGLVIGLDAHDFGLIQQHAVGNDFGFEPGGAELLRHVLGGLVILGRGGQVRLGGEGLQFLAGQFGVGHGEELLFELGFGAEVGVAEARPAAAPAPAAGCDGSPAVKTAGKRNNASAARRAHRIGPLSGLNQLPTSVISHRLRAMRAAARRQRNLAQALRAGLGCGSGRGLRLLQARQQSRSWAARWQNTPRRHDQECNRRVEKIADLDLRRHPHAESRR